MEWIHTLAINLNVEAVFLLEYRSIKTKATVTKIQLMLQKKFKKIQDQEQDDWWCNDSFQSKLL